MLEDLMKNATWIGNAHPRLPAFAGKSPPAVPVATSFHSEDMLVVSLAGKLPETMTCGCFAALLRDSKADGTVHVGDKDGTTKIASFEVIRRYIFGLSGRPSASAHKA